MAGEYGEEKVAAETETTREELYKQHYEQGGDPPVEEKKEELAEQPPAEAAKPEEAKEEVKEELKEPLKEQEKEQKTVPYDALHKERKLRQESDAAKKAAEARAKALEDELARLKSQEQHPEEITDYEKEILELKRREQQRQEREAKEAQDKRLKEQEEAQQKARDAINKTMSDINSELEAEGFDGFELAQDAVSREIGRLIDEDESNVSLDTKNGWKQVYKERIFPKVVKTFSEANQKRERVSKEELKKQANIHTPSGGKPPAKPKTADDMTEAERNAAYINMRNARRGE